MQTIPHAFVNSWRIRWQKKYRKLKFLLRNIMMTFGILLGWNSVKQSLNIHKLFLRKDTESFRKHYSHPCNLHQSVTDCRGKKIKHRFQIFQIGPNSNNQTSCTISFKEEVHFFYNPFCDETNGMFPVL